MPSFSQYPAPLSLFLVAYLMGSLSFAVIISYFIKAPDPRSYGSGNPGATNMLRGGRKIGALLTLLGDGMKGYWATSLGCVLNEPMIAATCGICVFMGHLYPIFFRFKGGKGVATALGVLLAFSPRLALSALVVWLIVLLMSRISSFSAIVAATTLPIFAFLLWDLKHPYFWATLIMVFLTLCRHRSNLSNLLHRKEKPIID